MPESAAETFTCPVCSRTSHNPNDAQHGYCGACHGFTGNIAADPTVAEILSPNEALLYPSPEILTAAMKGDQAAAERLFRIRLR